MNSKIQASFYDISNIVYSPIEGFCHKKQLIPLYKDKDLLKKYIIENNMNLGDIIFIGGNSDRQEYCFGIVIEDGEYINGDYGPFIIFEKRHIIHLEKIKNKNISYKNVLDKINNNLDYRDLFFGNYDEEDNSYLIPYNDNNLL